MERKLLKGVVILLLIGLISTLSISNFVAGTDGSGMQPINPAETGTASSAIQGDIQTPGQDQALNANAAHDTRTKPRMRSMTPAERKAAAERLKSTLANRAIAPDGIGIAGITPGPGDTPDYFGVYPNYANSPLPTVTGSIISAGNQLIGREYPTDLAANVFVIGNQAPLSSGTLTEIQTYNQPGSGPNTFNAYVLRPTGVPDQYTVIFDSGPLSVPSVATGQVLTFPVGPINVQAGDLIAHYGQGVPIDIPATPGGSGNDTTIYPANKAPVANQVITLGGIDYPIYSTDRTYSLAATVSTTTISGGIRKFVDSLPGLGPSGIPIAVPDSTTYTGSDYYEIALVEYTQKMHTDLPPTKLRGYVQLVPEGWTGTDLLGNSYSAVPLDINGVTYYASANPTYLGPVVIALRDTPVRIKFTNLLPTGAGGDLFLPVDTTYMGAGEGPIAGQNYTQNRATLHLHGGTTPWISDGTPHQWTTPAGENTPYPEGVSVSNVPDMDGGNEPNGTLTFYYTNQQSARLMFYHDHAYGITRLNVYAGEAAGYLLTDPVEQTLINGGTITPAGGTPVTVGAGTLPDVGIPLVIQDKTFVPDNTIPFTNLVGTFASQLKAQDPTWNTTKWGDFGQLWFPHVYMPNQNPGDLSGANPMGRWDYGPWFWPPFTGLAYGPIPNPYYDPACVSSPTTYCEGPQIPGTPDARLISPSGVPEAFMDTPLVNGKAYPVLNVPAGVVRFRILNAANDRFWNLQLYVADPNVTTADGRTNTEVKMVPFNSNQNLITPFPAWWYTARNPFSLDDRAGGVPDPRTRGPAMIQIGTEGGFLPAPVVILNQPVNYNYNRRDITVLNVLEKALFLGPAERADVIVDFSKFAGKTLILYNDAPSPVPAADPRIDYYTGDPDQTDTGGAPSTLAGYGPNTRTIMQIRVAGTDSGIPGPVDDVNQTILTALNTALPAAFNASQDTIIVPQAPYNAVYNANFPGDARAYVKIQDTNFTFDPIGPTGAFTMEMEPKAIIEDFTMDYGRMNAILGNEIRHTNVITQTSIIQAFIDPPVELINITDIGTPIGSLSDGTQIWKFTHNGVDTHAIHFHLFTVQLINRVGWDGAIKPPDPNELGWKDTVRMNPLEDIIVALRPIKLTNLPFKIPNSIRPMDVTKPLGSTIGFTNVDPNGNPVTPGITNQLVNFGWEYVYHCHLLGHEENDMMRPVVVSVSPDAPSALVAIMGSVGSPVILSWTDNSSDEINFTIQRATDVGFTTGLTNFMVSGSANGAFGGNIAFTDTTVAANTQYYYRVLASNVVGVLNLGAYPNNTINSAPSNTVTVKIPPPPTILAPTNLQATINAGPRRITLTWTDASNNEASFVVWRSDNGGAYTMIGTVARTATQSTATGGSVTFNNTNTLAARLVAGHTYTYYVRAINGTYSSAPSNTVTVLFSAPAAPTGLTGTAVRIAGNQLQDRVTLDWTDNANNENNFQIQRATNPNFNNPTTYTVGANVVSFTQDVSRANDYYYRVRATNAVGNSGWSNVVFVTAP